MKKLNIPSQLLLLFFTIILVASCAFSVIALTRIQVIAEDEVYSRLSTYVYLINNKGEEKLPDMNIGYYIKEPNYSETYKSPTLSNYITEDDLAELIQRIKEDNLSQEFPRKSFLANGYIKNAQKKIYYVVSTEDNLENYTIIFTDNKYTDSMVKNVALQVILLFFLLILVSIYVIYLWSSKLVKRIKMIQNHILNLPRDKYAISYVDDSLDEVGDLSKSIEKMRQEIEKNENTKQEMLQNLSHDFKTPIAVIKSYAEAFQDKVVDENEASKIIISQAEILKKKVNRLLQYNSLEYLDKNREFEDVDMKELVLEVIQNYRFQTNIVFELDLSDNIFFKGYRENFYTVVDNIVDNAKRYAKTKIKIVLRKDRLRIYNDGDPIDEQFLNSVFKPYEKGSKGEFGLGMSIVKKTIDFFGLELKVVNEVVGVSFIISKPKNN